MTIPPVSDAILNYEALDARRDNLDAHARTSDFEVSKASEAGQRSERRTRSISRL
jgi:hypothetical protein